MLLTSNRRVRHCLGGRQFLVAFIFWSGMVSNIGPTGILQRFLSFLFVLFFLISFSCQLLYSESIWQAGGRYNTRRLGIRHIWWFGRTNRVSEVFFVVVYFFSSQSFPHTLENFFSFPDSRYFLSVYFSLSLSSLICTIILSKTSRSGKRRGQQ